MSPLIDDHQLSLLSHVRPRLWPNPEPFGRYDLLVIGGGAAGVTAARAAIGRGARVALVESHMLGGVSLLSGSVPSKALIRASHHYAEMRRTATFGGVEPVNVEENFDAAMDRVRRIRARISEQHSAERLRLIGLDLYFGAARFIGDDAVRLGDLTLRFKRALIATGARSLRPPIPGLEAAKPLTSENVFELTQRPDSLLVIGAGPLGCELAQSFRRLGSKVYLVQDEPKFLPREERDAAQILSEALARDGVEIHLNTTVVAVRQADTGRKLVDVVSDDQRATITTDHILTAVGRLPNVQGLNLEQADIAYDDNLGVRVDDFLRTSNRRVYAAGDCCLEQKFTHTAEASARLAVANALCGGRSRWSAVTVPWCTYTDPEIAHVGLYVSEARDASIPVQTITALMHDADRAVIDGRESGFVKIHVRDGSDEILGATILACHASEMISELTLAINAGIGLSTLARTLHAYPAQSNAIKLAAESFERSRGRSAQGHDAFRPEWPVQ